MKPLLEVKNVSKSYHGISSLENISFAINKSEIFCILGPSGCGKTTLLRILAGLEYPDKGDVFLNNKNITTLKPQERPLNIMFQNYLLFPHMNVFENIAYGLRRNGIDKEEIQKKVFALLKLVKLESFVDRMPSTLSGGQKQRTALARSLAREPLVLLLDEPMAALDRKLREETQAELISLQNKLGTTFIFVTHDHEEAMYMADTIAILNNGKIIQQDKPQDLYNFPKNKFVAEFFGDANLFSGLIYKIDGNRIYFDEENKLIYQSNYKRLDKKVGDKLVISILPEKLKLEKNSDTCSDFNCISVLYENIVFKKNYWNVIVKTKNSKLIKVTVSSKEQGFKNLSKNSKLFLKFKQSCGIVLNEN